MCETFSIDVLEHSFNSINKDELLNLKYENGVVRDFLNSMIAKIGENLILNDVIIKDNKNSEHSFYIHNSYKNIGKIISTIQYSRNNNDAEIQSLSKNLCMHIAAMKLNH